MLSQALNQNGEDQFSEELLTPEERLLKVIRAKGNLPPKENFRSSRKRERFFHRFVLGVRKSFAEFHGALKGSPLSWIKQKSQALQDRWTFHQFPFSKLNKGVTSLLILLAVLFLADQIVQRVNQMPLTGSYPTPGSANPNYLNPSGNAPGAAASSSAATGWTASPSGQKNFRLVGITWNEKGFVAMIEMAGESSAHFVRKGDELTHDVKVKDIKQFSVILSSRGREWELN